MATTKTINTRIQLRYDTLTNWQSEATAGKGALLVLNKGEMALCYVPAVIDTATQKVLTAPTVLFKVGDGTNTFKDLPWGSAVAADVYGWAKEKTKPSYTAQEISGLDDYISGAIQDTDTQYQIIKGVDIAGDADDYTYILQSKPLGGSVWTDVSTINIPKDTLVEGTTNGTVKFNGTDVAVHGLKSAAYEEGATLVGNAVSDVTGAESNTWETKKSLWAVHREATAAANAAGTAQTAAEAAQATADKAAVAATGLTGATKTKITYNSQGIVTKGEDIVASDITSGVFELDRIPTIPRSKTSDFGDAAAKNVASSIVVDSVDEGLVTAKDVAAFVKNQVAGLSGAMHFIGTSTSDPMGETGATVAGHDTFNAGDVCLYGNKEYVYTGTAWVELGDEGSYVLKTTKVNGHALTSDITLTASDVNAYTKTETNSAITNAINNLDVAKAGGGTAQYIKSISQTDGIISAEVETMKALTIGDSANGKTYDGSAAVSITAADLGAATVADINGKLDKATKTGDGTYVYTVSGSTQATTWQVATSSEPAPGQIPTYDALSRLKTADPAADNDAANKKYVDNTISTELGKHAGIDKEGTVTSVAAGTGLKVTGTASVNPTVEIDDAVIFILNGGSATTVIE